jgi:hypothetical protein
MTTIVSPAAVVILACEGRMSWLELYVRVREEVNVANLAVPICAVEDALKDVIVELPVMER